MSLFEESLPARKRAGDSGKDGSFILNFDGGSRGNPGPAGIGVTLTRDNGDAVYELGEFLGTCTNNVAEYTAFLRGLAAAAALKARKVTVRSDSELLVRQINGVYKVRSPDLKPLHEKAQSLMRQIGDVKVQHVYRASNSRADELANMAMDARQKIEPLGPPAQPKAQPASDKSRKSEEPFPRLHFPGGAFDERMAYESEAKGYLGSCEVELEDGSRHGVTFYDPARLAQDLQEEAKLGRPFIAEQGMIVLEAITLANMLAAVRKLVSEGFFKK